MDIFEELGIRRYINAQDTFTKYGASCMGEESLRAMAEIAGSMVDLAEVQEKTGDAIAGLTGIVRQSRGGVQVGEESVGSQCGNALGVGGFF